MIYCPKCEKPIIKSNGEHIRSVAELKSGTYICNNFMCIVKSGGTRILKATSGKMTDV